MILFINSGKAYSQLIPYKETSSLNLFEINFRNKALLKKNMLELITNFMEALSYEEEKFILVINDLDDAYINLQDSDDEVTGITKKMFKALIDQYIKMGHEIVYFNGKHEPVIQDILELAELDGFDIITDEIKLYNKLITDTK